MANEDLELQRDEIPWHGYLRLRDEVIKLRNKLDAWRVLYTPTPASPAFVEVRRLEGQEWVPADDWRAANGRTAGIRQKLEEAEEALRGIRIERDALQVEVSKLAIANYRQNRRFGALYTAVTKAIGDDNDYK